MAIFFNSIDADLSIEPVPLSTKYGSHYQFSFGDLHGNAMKLIYLLVQNDFITLRPGEYLELKAIYETPTEELTTDQLDEFERIIQEAHYHGNGLIRLIGDELADRGENDYFTLLMLDTLAKQKIPLNIMLSNHNIVALMQFDHEETRGQQYIGGNMQRSLDNMWKLFKKPGHEVYRDKVLEIVEKVYRPSLRILDYCVTEINNLPEVTLFSHAPIGLETVRNCAKDYGIQYDDSSIKKLTGCIDSINQRASSSIQDGTFTTLDYNPAYNVFNIPALQQIFWARTLANNFTLTPDSDFLVRVVHGHVGEVVQLNFDDPPEIGEETNRENFLKKIFSNTNPLLFNLDNNLGKTPDLQNRKYPLFVEENLTLKPKKDMELS